MSSVADREGGGVRGLALEGRDDGREARVALARDARLDELDAVEPANDLLGRDGLIEHGLGRRAGGRDHDGLEDLLGARVDELRGQERDERERQDEQCARAREHPELRPAVAQRATDERCVDAHPQRLRGLAVLVDLHGHIADEQVAKDGDHRERADERGQQREGHGQRERQEQLADDAAHEADGQEHRHRREGRRGDRAGDLLRAAGGGRPAILTHRPVAIDVLEDDDRIVDHPSDGDGQAAKGHDVQGDPGQLHHDERREHRERDADGRDQRRADREQEQEDHDHREQRAQAALAQETVLRLDDERWTGRTRWSRSARRSGAPARRPAPPRRHRRRRRCSRPRSWSRSASATAGRSCARSPSSAARRARPCRARSG